MTSAARLRRCADVESFREAAHRRLPQIFFDYLDGGASAETTLRANCADFDRFQLRPCVLRDVSSCKLDAEFLGGHHDLPVMLGPIGSLGVFRADGEAASFRAAKCAGIPACLSSFTVTRPERLSATLGAGAAFQLYALKDRDRTEAVLDRVSGCGFGTLFVTVDTAVSGIRERDIRNGLRMLSQPSLRMVLDLLSHPSWLADIARAHPVRMALAEDWSEAGEGYLEQAAFLARQIDPAFDWQGLAWLRARWHGRLVVKGILTADDALRCVDQGVDGIVVSNHGGRQLDGVSSSITALGDIAAAVSGRTEILLDSGIRRGGDVAKALALGASACLLGRAYVYGLVAAGEAGIAAVLSSIRAELEVTLALLGLRSIRELRDAGPGIVRQISGPDC
ncbi:alpha-hydroxy-acid oxidizing protein [Mesorhizobium sp. AR07]|uniref:alpha-hydroxy acid oxidase n=1 Tax=Mesorhizobium sp. AR07 TaxID=2865838 RepID=UPI00215EB331|nr:alpha-hydroxy acid oxidase [Mesorhizobium sp. AR07]UVK41830.1 alpha-hydroxy-acid oxidizing protein [Mesorhizobium sp. AR07]